MYICQDPIGLWGGIVKLYGFVDNLNTWSDPLGLSKSCGGKARRRAEQRAAKLRKQYDAGKIATLPIVTSVAVNRKTGKSYYGYSRTRPQTIHPTIQKQMPKKSKVGNRPPNNCAEFDAVNKAMLDGAGSMNNVDVYTVKTSTGEAMTRCDNCKESTKGTHTHSD